MGRGLWAWSDSPSFLSLADHMSENQSQKINPRFRCSTISQIIELYFMSAAVLLSIQQSTNTISFNFSFCIKL